MPWLLQVIRFLAVGVLNTLVDTGLYLALTRWLGLAALPALAKSISYSTGVVNSFFLNRSWTFRSRAGGFSTFGAFLLLNLASSALNAGVLHLGLSVVGLPEVVAFLAATGASFVLNFCLSKFAVFRETSASFPGRPGIGRI